MTKVSSVVGGERRCPYLPRPDDMDDNRLHDFRDQILVCMFLVSVFARLTTFPKASPKDIEELIVSGQASRTCPYFASREAISQAEVLHFLDLWGVNNETESSTGSHLALQPPASS